MDMLLGCPRKHRFIANGKSDRTINRCPYCGINYPRSRLELLVGARYMRPGVNYGYVDRRADYKRGKFSKRISHLAF